MDAQDQTSDQLQKQVQAVTEENLQLRDKYERLFTKVGHLETRLSHLATSNTDLSHRLVQSEEERLKIYKELVEEKIQTNKIREHYEEETFELKTKILNQEGVITELEIERDRLFRELESTGVSLRVKGKNGQDLTEEHATLKKNYQILVEAHNKELAKSGELTAELLALAQAQDALHRQLEEQHQCVKTTTEGLHGELDRVRALISHIFKSLLTASHSFSFIFLTQLLENQDEIKDKLEKMKSSYKEQQKKLEEKVVAMGKEHQEINRAMHISQQKLSEQSAALMCSQSQLKEVEEENSKLQLRLKELNEEYRARLVYYLEDLADYFDGLGESKSPSEQSKMRAFLDSMLQDVRLSYRVREEQLATAARSYKKRLQRITKTHHALLIAYRVQRDQILAKPENNLEPGPPEAHFSLEPTELKDAIEKELQQLRQDKARLEGQLQASRDQSHDKLKQLCEESCGDIRKQLREITEFQFFKQASFEKERALLLTRAAVAEAQVLELQNYTDNHLGRYEQEITHLRGLHGTVEEEGRSQSAHLAPH
uniref:Coiled-coil domain containing 78 n=1 Tax=Amphilophus citrinellus TaxID=61819 RepID=A0A3Q0RGQ4_AMPCI